MWQYQESAVAELSHALPVVVLELISAPVVLSVVSLHATAVIRIDQPSVNIRNREKELPIAAIRFWANLRKFSLQRFDRPQDNG